MASKRRPHAQVIAGLPSKAEKIRALARAGYERTEIAAILNVRYQNVRKVLVDAGISDETKRKSIAEHTPADTANGADAAPVSSWDSLLRAGFLFIGEWVLGNEGAIFLGTAAPVDSGVYAFVVDDMVKYVGLTQRGLRHRFGKFGSRFLRHNTKARVEVLIAETLDSGKRVKVLVATPEPLDWNGLPVHTHAGLEAGLIAAMRPEWNLRGGS